MGALNKQKLLSRVRRASLAWVPSPEKSFEHLLAECYRTAIFEILSHHQLATRENCDKYIDLGSMDPDLSYLKKFHAQLLKESFSSKTLTLSALKAVRPEILEGVSTPIQNWDHVDFELRSSTSSDRISISSNDSDGSFLRGSINRLLSQNSTHRNGK